eukprot:COSAG06_NODE_2447_length_6864_cov_3.888101_3_plen_484_part_00
MEARRAELQGMKKSAQRKAAEAVGIDEDDWDGTVDSILAAETRAGGAQAYVTRKAEFRGATTQARDTSVPLKAKALVIGIRDYVREPLKNTVHDATDIAAKLTSPIGFDVTLLTDDNGADLSSKGLKKAIRKFIKEVDANTAVAFAFMGHGAELDGEHYLLPQEMVEEPEDLPDEAIHQQKVLADIEAKKPIVTLAILDCCRETVSGTRSAFGGPGGLAAKQGPVGSLVMYATGEGQLAQDGSGHNGVFTEALLQYIDQPMRLDDIAMAVCGEVQEKTGGKQVPEQRNALSAAVHFVTAEPQPAPAPAPAVVPAATLGAVPAAASPRPAVKTLADFVAACEDVDSMEELLADYSSQEEFAALLEAYDGLLKDKTKPPGRKQREKLLSEHAASTAVSALFLFLRAACVLLCRASAREADLVEVLSQPAQQQRKCQGARAACGRMNSARQPSLPPPPPPLLPLLLPLLFLLLLLGRGKGQGETAH